MSCTPFGFAMVPLSEPQWPDGQQLKSLADSYRAYYGMKTFEMDRQAFQTEPVDRIWVEND